MKTNEYDEEPVYYCTRCFSLDIRENEKQKMYCHHCGADVYKIDVCNFPRWEQLYTEHYGEPLIKKTSIYDDLTESYQEDAEEILTDHEALENGLCVGDFLKRSNKTLNI